MTVLPKMEFAEDEHNAIEAVPYDSLSPQKSPISKYISALSPIKELRNPRRLFDSSFSTPVSVFGSTPVDLQAETSFFKRENIIGSSSNAHGKCHAKQLQYCSPYEGADGYLTGSLEVDSAKQHAGKYLQSANDVIQQLPSLFRASEVTTEKIDYTNGCFVGVGQQVAPLHQQGIRRHLQFVDTSNCMDAFKFHTSATPRSAIQSLIESKQVMQSALTRQRVLSLHLILLVPLEMFGIRASQLGSISTSISFKKVDVLSRKNLAILQSSQENHIPMSSNYFLKETNDPLMSTGQEGIDLVDNNNQRRQAVAVGDHLPEITVPPWESQQISSFDQQTVPRDGNMPGKQFVEMVEEQSQSQDSSLWKRKRETSTDDKEGCKRCNCKRSKCLKLYCECFAAGVYCADSCACENCLNKPDFEDSVSDAREQIESRNPLAFAPTVVEQTNIDSPNVMDDGSWITSSSARHKRGCKCKRSKCLKKYCECYRAKVGCSDGCHCESCDNSFGKKSEIVVHRAEKWMNLSHGGTPDQLSSTWEQLVDVNHLPPLTYPHSTPVPFLPSSNMGDCPNIAPDQLQWCSPTLSSQGRADGVSHDLGSMSALCDIMEDSSPDIGQFQPHQH